MGWVGLGLVWEGGGGEGVDVSPFIYLFFCLKNFFVLNYLQHSLRHTGGLCNSQLKFRHFRVQETHFFLASGLVTRPWQMALIAGLCHANGLRFPLAGAL